MHRLFRGIRAAAWWLLPVAFLIILYWRGLSMWFLADDFAWLSLTRAVHNFHDLLEQMFSPMAQGTIRPWSERGYFMALEALFGMDSLPFRIVAMATAAADVLLVAWITLRITGSRVAGFLAPILWAANAELVRAMTWNSAYNELLCPLFLLTALALLIRYAETGRRAFWWWQAAIFTLGFGALEVNIVYPALAAAWVLLAAHPEQRKPLLKSLTPLAAISAGYLILHRIAVPFPESGPYVMHWNASIFRTLGLYWTWALVPPNFQEYGHRHVVVVRIVVLLTAAVIAFLICELKQRRLTVLFFLAWFAITIAPVLPLSEHHSDYYLSIPVIGLAMLGAAATGRAVQGSWLKRAIVVVPLVVYFLTMAPIAYAATHWWVSKSLAVRAMVLGTVAARRTHPGQAIVLEGVTTELFNDGLADSPFYAAGIDDVYLTPQSALTIQNGPGRPEVAGMTADPAALWHGITHDQVVVYSVERNHLRNITGRYARELGSLRDVDRLPNQADVGNSLYSWLLGPTWMPAGSGYRWMPGRATIRLGVPEGAKWLELSGICPEEQLSQGPRHLMILIDGKVAAETRIYSPESDFNRQMSISGLAGKTAVDLEIRVDPVFRKEGQEYGVIFGKIGILP